MRAVFSNIGLVICLVMITGCKTVATKEEVPTAVKSVAEAFKATGQVRVKYCPYDGKRYSAHLKVCPEHGLELKMVE